MCFSRALRRYFLNRSEANKAAAHPPFIYRRDYSASDAQDLPQDFFPMLLQGRLLQTAIRSAGASATCCVDRWEKFNSCWCGTAAVISVVIRTFDLALPPPTRYAKNVKALVSSQKTDALSDFVTTRWSLIRNGHISEARTDANAELLSSVRFIGIPFSHGKRRPSGGFRVPSAATFLFSSQDVVPSATNSKAPPSDFRKGFYEREVS